jgi:hypothetical protein
VSSSFKEEHGEAIAGGLDLGWLPLLDPVIVCGEPRELSSLGSFGHFFFPLNSVPGRGEYSVLNLFWFLLG